MSHKRRRILLVAVTVGALAWLARDPDAPPPPVTNPVYSEVRGFLDKVYDVGRWSVKVPVEVAKPEIVRAGLEVWVASLPLAPDVRGRVEGRLKAEGLVDELVPFALFVKDMYAQEAPEDYATWARAHVPRKGVPGLEHTLFAFNPPETKGASIPKIPGEQAAQLIRLYDAVYLQQVPGASEELTCATTSDATLAARADAAAPVVRGLLTSVAEKMGLEGDMRGAVDHVVKDDDLLQTVTLTLVEFINTEVCKHYRVFAQRTVRQHQLRGWLDEALLTPGRDDGWQWLGWQAYRTRGVHVVVDGLQGHLVEALARGEAQDPFLKSLLFAEVIEARAKPKLPSTRPGPAMDTDFLHYVAQYGYSDSNYLPFFKKLYSEQPAGIARQGLSTTPTISVRNLPIAKTGAPVGGPGGTGIPNFHFVDRGYTQDGVQQGRPWYFYGNDALQLTRLTTEAGMRTMFERMPRLVTMSCGAQYDELAGYSFDSFLALAVGETSRDFGDLRCTAELAVRVKNERRIAEIRAALLERRALLAQDHYFWEWYDRWTQSNERDEARKLIAEMAALEPEGMPDYLLYYNPWPDHFAHAKGPFSDEIIGPTGELSRLDHWLGVVSDYYTQAGVADRTMFGMAGDHGLTPVRWIVSPEKEVLEGLEKSGVKLVVKKISSDEGEGPKLTNRLHPPSMRGIDVVVASTAGGNYMMDFFVDQGANWGRQPVLAELRSLRTLGGKTVDVVGETVRRLGDSLDYLVVRETPCTPDGGVIQVINTRGTGTIERRGDRIWYGWEGEDVLGLGEESPYHPPKDVLDPEKSILLQMIANGQDPLDGAPTVGGMGLGECVHASRDAPDTWCTEQRWRAATWMSARPDSVVQLSHLYDTDRAGTVNLFPRDGVGYNTNVPGRHAGESFHEKDAFVGIWGAPVRQDQGRLTVAVNGEVPMAIYHWITGEETTEGKDGWGYPAMPETLFKDGHWREMPKAIAF